MDSIESTANKTYRTLLSLTTAKGLKKESWLLLAGEKLIREFAANPHLAIHYEIVSGRMSPLPELAWQKSIKRIRLAAALFDTLDVSGTHFNILAVQQPDIQKIDIDKHRPQGIELVLPVGDPGNLGALIRSAEAFGVPKIILTQEAAHPFLPKSIKASAGSVLRVPLARGPALKDFPDSVMALDMNGTPINRFKWPANGLLVVGEEGPGVGRNFPTRIAIPTRGVQSLNAVVATSIALSHKASLT